MGSLDNLAHYFNRASIPQSPSSNLLEQAHFGEKLPCGLDNIILLWYIILYIIIYWTYIISTTFTTEQDRIFTEVGDATEDYQ